jgi:hypothetical protein
MSGSLGEPGGSAMRNSQWFLALTLQRITWEVEKVLMPRLHPYQSDQNLTSVIPATQEAELRRIVVRSQPGQKVHETLH